MMANADPQCATHLKKPIRVAGDLVSRPTTRIAPFQVA
jgi:hypothetical protein